MDTQSKPTKSRRKYRNYPPRPCNSFMIYRREYHQNNRKRFPNIILSEVSVISRSAADEWAQEPPHVKVAIGFLKDQRYTHSKIHGKYQNKTLYKKDYLKLFEAA